MPRIELEFQKIYETFKPKIFRYLTRLIGEHEAEDLTQEVFIKVNHALKNFRGESRLSTWIYRIATNAAIDKLRARPSQEKTSGDTIIADQIETEDKDVWTGKKKPSIETSLIRKEMNECIRSFIDTLPEDFKAVIVLSELEGLKNHEIAEILGISLDTVKIRLHRARTRLKKELETHCSFYRNEQNEIACDLRSAFIEFKKRH